MTEINPYIFRAYDVRGKVGIDILPEVFSEVGRAYGTLVRRRGGRTVAIGMDNRTTSPPLKEAFAEGMLSTGLDVVDIGVNHTPLLYFAVAHWRLDGGATVTGSHNPVSDNGVKMVHAEAAPLREEEIQGLLATIRAGDFERGQGKRTARSPREDYFAAITERVKVARKLRVVVDAGNGIAGSFAPELLRRLGCEVTELYCESDGTFPNHLPDPEMEENVRDLVAKVVETRADVGIAYDGDADRMGVIDDRGRRHEADLILALLARDLLTRHPGPRRQADHVEDRPFSPQAEDARRRHPPRRRGLGAHVLRRELVRGRRRYPGLVQVPRARRTNGRIDLGPLRHAPPSRLDAGAQGALPRRQEVRRGRRARGGVQGALRDHRHRRGAHPLSRRLGARTGLEHQPVPDPALRGPHPGRRGQDESRGPGRAQPLPLRPASRLACRQCGGGGTGMPSSAHTSSPRAPPRSGASAWPPIPRDGGPLPPCCAGPLA